jgi:hypothetical protein
MIEKKESKNALLSAENARRNAKPSNNVFYKKQEWNVTTC